VTSQTKRTRFCFPGGGEKRSRAREKQRETRGGRSLYREKRPPSSRPRTVAYGGKRDKQKKKSLSSTGEGGEAARPKRKKKSAHAKKKSSARWGNRDGFIYWKEDIEEKRGREHRGKRRGGDTSKLTFKELYS